MLAQRPDAAPGQFKTAPNRVGEVEFVRPDAVVGTLERGFEMYRTLDTPFRRAAFIHFLVSEVHPFADGNGRVARMMMTAELVAGNQERIVIPTVYRDNYIAGQRTLTAGHGARAMLGMLDFAWAWTAAVPWRGFETTMTTLRACHASTRPNGPTVSEPGSRCRPRLAVPRPVRPPLALPRIRCNTMNLLRHNTVRGGTSWRLGVIDELQAPIG